VTQVSEDQPTEVDSRVYYASSVHDEAEINAVLEVLRDPRGFWVGKRVNAMERAVADLFGKRRGVMVNSGSSALYLALELARPTRWCRSNHSGRHLLDRPGPTRPRWLRTGLRRRRIRHLQH